MQVRPPLTPAVFSILFALSDGEKHGYEIMKRVRSDTRGTVKMGTGTLYGSIKRMLEAGLIEDAGDRFDASLDGVRRRYYRVTDRGHDALEAELKRYSDLVSIARQRRLLGRLATGQSR